MHARSHFYLRFSETEILKAIRSLQREIPLTEMKVKRGQFLLDELPQEERVSKILLIFLCDKDHQIAKIDENGISKIIRSSCEKRVYFNNLLAFVCHFPLPLYIYISIFTFTFLYFLFLCGVQSFWPWLAAKKFGSKTIES